MKTKPNKILRIFVLPIILFFSSATFAGNSSDPDKCKSESCVCTACDGSCGDQCDGKTCSLKGDAAACCNKINDGKSCCKSANADTKVKTTANVPSCHSAEKTESKATSCCGAKGSKKTEGVKGGNTTTSCHAGVSTATAKAACCNADSGTKCTGNCNEKCAECKDCKEKGCENCCTADGCSRNSCCDVKK